MNFHNNRPAVDKAVKAAAKKGLTDAAMVWHGDATRLTPVDTGTLRASLAWAVSGSRHHSVGVSNYRVTAPDMTARVGTNLDYAPAVHEDLDAHHPVGQAKFIETPLRERGEDYMDLIRKALREGIK